MRRECKWSVAALVLILFVSVSVYAAKPFPREAVIPTLETALQELGNKPPLQAEALATSLGMNVKMGKIRVVVEFDESFNEGDVIKLGGAIVARAEELNMLEVDVPIARLLDLARLPGVRFVRRPYRPTPVVVSEGVKLTSASTWHTAGIRGQGIKIAVIDGGFDGLATAVASGTVGNVVYTHDYTSEGLETGGVHGTACAEIVHDMAPDAQLLLMKIGTGVELAQAVDDAVTHGAKIISHSMGWFNTNFYDGTGPIAAIAAKATSHGILWVNSAGNSADGGHWEGDWYDADGDGWLEFYHGDETNSFTLDAGETVILYLTWDSWPTTDQDYDLYLFDSMGRVVASSQNYQTGTQPPTEYVSYTAPIAGSYGLAIYATNVPDHPRLELFAIPYSLPLEYSIATSSIPAPGNASSVFTTGAIEQTDWTVGPHEPFSSQGPTNASQYASARIKPDICGPDGTESFTYNGRFYGTSAAAPHVAGAAALSWSLHPDWSVDAVRHFLEENAIDMGPLGKDNVYGYGRLSLPVPSMPGESEKCCSFNAGWNLISLPVDPSNSDPAAVFDGVAAVLRLYEYDKATGGWKTTQDGTLTDVTGPMTGYWLWLPADTTVCFTGTVLEAPQTLNLGAKGWQMIGVPYEVAWGNATGVPISVTNGAVTKSLADAVAAGWIYDTVWAYDTLNSRWIKTKVSEGTTLVPCKGYWIYTYVNDLVLNFTEEQGPSGSTQPSAKDTVEVKAPGSPPLPAVPTAVSTGLKVVGRPNPIMEGSGISFFSVGICPCLVEGIRVEVYDLAGRSVWSDETGGATVFWRTEDMQGEPVANGVYLYRAWVKVREEWEAVPLGKVVVLR